MKIEAIKTEKITPGKNLFKILDKYVPELKNGSILAITSKIISICEGRIIPITKINKDELTKQEADFYIPKKHNKYKMFLTIKNNLLSISAGIDESNANGYYVLWPKDSQKTANEARSHIKKRFGLKNVGVIITDSKTTPLRWGVTGAAIAHSGFSAINDLIGTSDIFGRKLKFTKIAVLDALAVAAVFEMGEGDNQTPLAVITDASGVEFQDRNPTKKEIQALKIKLKDDIYAPLLKSAPWEKGKK